MLNQKPSKPKLFQNQNSKPKLQNQFWFWCMPNPRSKRVHRILSDGHKIHCDTENQIRSITCCRIPMWSAVFLWYPLIGFVEFRSDPYIRNRPDPISGSDHFRSDSGWSGVWKLSVFVGSHDTGFQDKTVQLLLSELVGLHMNVGDPLIGFFRVG